MAYFSGTKLTKFNLSKTVRRNIERQEQNLGRICRSIWAFTNPLGEHFIFASFTTGNFPKDRDRVIVTLAYWNNSILRYLSVH